MKYNKSAKLISTVASVLLAFWIGTQAEALTLTTGGYPIVREYRNNFSDVSADAWYYDEVASAYSLGLMNGKSDTEYSPDGNLTIAEAIKLASSVHQLLTTGKTADIPTTGKYWYDGYISYAKRNNIVTEDYDNYDKGVTRAQVAVLFSRTIMSAANDSGELPGEVNKVEAGSLPDVVPGVWYGDAVYRMYNWGIMTGDTEGKIKPDSTITRGEISAIVIRMIDEDSRVKVGENKTENDSMPSEDTNKDNTDGNTSGNTSTDVLTIYSAEKIKQSFTGITAAAAEIYKSNGEFIVDDSYSITVLSDVKLEKDCLSFRLYDGYGYEAFGIVRGWLNEQATGANGKVIRSAPETETTLRTLASVYINGKKLPISQLWYADHEGNGEGGYTEYALYFSTQIDLDTVREIDFVIGKLGIDEMQQAGLDRLAGYAEGGNTPEYGGADTGNGSDTSFAASESNYKASIDDAMGSAYEVLFQYEFQRCCVIYGRGLYGRDKSEYRLIFIFRDGTAETVAAEKLGAIRVNDAGDVLYYSVTAPDGKAISYGVNFGN